MRDVFAYVIGLGAAVMMPIIFTVLGVCIGIRLSKALKSGLLVGVGFVGLGVVTALLTSNLGPALKGTTELYHLNLPYFDLGWPAAAAVAYSTAVGAFIIPVCLGVNVLMLLTKTTRTINIDLWNYWHFAFLGAMVFFATGSLAWAFYAAIVLYVITLCMADFTAKGFQAFYKGAEGLSIPQPFCQSFTPFAVAIGWLLDRIPGFGRLDIDAEGLKRKFGLFGEPLFLGVIIGCGIGALRCDSWKGVVDAVPSILKLGVTVGAVMELIPRITGLFIEGLKPITQAVQEKLAKRFGGEGQQAYDSKAGFSIGMSPALVIGHPTTLVVSILLIPVILFLSVLLPGNKFLPLASLAGMFYLFPCVLPITKGNVPKTFVIGLVALVCGLYFVTNLTPAFTKAIDAAKCDGIAVPEGFDGGAALDFASALWCWAIYHLAVSFRWVGAIGAGLLALGMALVNRRRIVAAALVLVAVSVVRADGVSKAEYLGLMARAVEAYSPSHMADYLADVERDGVQEHGFPRLAANLGVLVANGRMTDRKALLKRMMDAACRDAAKGKMPPKSGGNEFSVKELALALVELERHAAFPKEVTDAWRAQLSAIEATRCYTTGAKKVGAPKAGNWVIFGAASEQTRRAFGLGGDAAFVERYVADQLRWFDENGMYRDPDQPAVYDLVTRLQFAQVLSLGYDGPSRARLEALMDRSAAPTLRLQSACGEIPYGGRSNQFLHNNTFYAALCEWYAVRLARRGETATAAAFRLAARRAVDALAVWLAESPVSHVKNRYPREGGKGVYSASGDMGCERYAYFDKYMVTMGSWAMSAWFFADESLPAAEPAAETDAFVTTPDFHCVHLRAGEYSAQFDYNADLHYDCDGLGRVQRRGAPGAICLASPCCLKPNYRIETPNDAPLAIGPAVNAPFVYDGARVDGEVSVSNWRVGDQSLKAELTAEGLSLRLSGKGPVALTLPALAFDGREEARVEVEAKALTVTYRGWVCRYTASGAIVDTGRVACNRNGRYRRFEARGRGEVKVKVEIVRVGE